MNKIIEYLNRLFKKKEVNTETERITDLEKNTKGSTEIGMDNDFLRLSRNNATLRTNKLISLIFSYIDFKSDNRDKKGELYVTIENSEINDFISGNVTSNKNVEFKEIARDIITASVVTGKINGINIAFPIIDYMQENENKTFTFKVNRIFTPYVQELQQRYSVLQLETIKGFKSNHAFVLYQELMSWYIHDKNEMAVKEQYYSTSQLFKLFGLSKDDYKKGDGKLDRFNFEQKVINRAVSEINKSGELRVLCSKIKVGNKVKAYKFLYGSMRDYEKIQERAKESDFELEGN